MVEQSGCRVDNRVRETGISPNIISDSPTPLGRLGKGSRTGADHLAAAPTGLTDTINRR